MIVTGNVIRCVGAEYNRNRAGEHRIGYLILSMISRNAGTRNTPKIYYIRTRSYIISMIISIERYE